MDNCNRPVFTKNFVITVTHGDSVTVKIERRTGHARTEFVGMNTAAMIQSGTPYTDSARECLTALVNSLALEMKDRSEIMYGFVKAYGGGNG